MRKVLKKILLIIISIIFINVFITGCSNAQQLLQYKENKMIAASVPNPYDSITKETVFGSISTYDIADNLDTNLHFRLDFDEEWLNSNEIDNYAGMELTLKVDGIGRAEFELESSTNNSWICTGRSNLGDGSNYLLLEKNNADGSKIVGDKNLYLIFTCPLHPDHWNLETTTATFSVVSDKITSDNGTLKTIDNVTETVTSTRSKPILTVNSTAESEIKKNDSLMLLVKSTDEGELDTFSALCDKLDLVTETGTRTLDPSIYEWSYLYKGHDKNTDWKKVEDNPDAKLGTGLLGLTRRGRDGQPDQFMRVNVIVLGDCSLEIENVTDENIKININDVAFMRKRLINLSVHESLLDDDYLEAGFITNFPNDEQFRTFNSIESISVYGKSNLSIADIIRTRQRILTKSWEF